MPAKPRDETGYRRFEKYIDDVGLGMEMRTICKRHTVTPRDIYFDSKGGTAHAARVEVWWWLVNVVGKSTLEVGNLFDRAATSISKALIKLYECAEELGKDLDTRSTREIAKVIAIDSFQKMRRSGLAVGRLNKKK